MSLYWEGNRKNYRPANRRAVFLSQFHLGAVEGFYFSD